MNTHESWIGAVLAQAFRPFEPWLSCDECFDRSDAVLEDLLDRNVPLPADFRAHLSGCPACRDEMESLAELAAADRGIDPAEGRARLDAQIRRA
jgi:thiol-disulfide isomerase/thioredoxin